MSLDRESREFEVCLCRKKTRGEIEDIIREKNISDIHKLMEIAEVGDKCGACRSDLEEILAKEISKRD